MRLRIKEKGVWGLRIRNSCKISRYYSSARLGYWTHATDRPRPWMINRLPRVGRRHYRMANQRRGLHWCYRHSKYINLMTS